MLTNSLRTASRLGRLPLRSVRWNSTANDQVPPLLLTMRSDLKTAMKAKDKIRLDVLRGVISEFNNCAKASRPIQSDIQFLAMLQKRIGSSKAAAEEFANANRSDLKEHEEALIAIMEEYASQVKTLSKEELFEIGTKEIEDLKKNGIQPQMSVLMKNLTSKLKGQATPGFISQTMKEALERSTGEASQKQ